MATVYLGIDPKAAIVGTTAIPELVLISGTNSPVMGYAFDAAAREDLYFSVPLLVYGSGSITATLHWYSRSGSTTGATIWGFRIAAITPGDAVSMEAKNWATTQTTTTTVNGTAKGLTSTAVVDSSNLDSAAALDTLWVNIYRDAAAGGDTMSGDAILTGLYLSYSDT
jgi:hypothetical protein